jgi:SAM-dependent methyltransferase
MAKLGADVTAFDFSARFIAWARRRSEETGDAITYHVLDAADEAQLLTLGERHFDAAVCNMALMDMTTVAPLLTALSRLLKVGGRFVFSLPHPSFNSNAVRWTAELEDRAGELTTTYAVTVHDYLHVPAGKGAGFAGQPQPHYYFHRPLSVLFNACFAAGFVLDGLEEPADPTPPDRQRPFGMQNRPGIPAAIVARMRLLA